MTTFAARYAAIDKAIAEHNTRVLRIEHQCAVFEAELDRSRATVLDLARHHGLSLREVGRKLAWIKFDSRQPDDDTTAAPDEPPLDIPEPDPDPFTIPPELRRDPPAKDGR